MRSFVIILVVCGLGRAASAQDYETAGRYFGAAQDAFARQHYKTAAADFQAAYDITKDPVLLFNIGEAWERGGDGARALAAYHAYVKAQPSAPDRGEVQKRVQAIEARHLALADQSAPGDRGEARLPEAPLAALAQPPAPSTSAPPPRAAPPSQAAPAAPQSTAPTSGQLAPAVPLAPSHATPESAVNPPGATPRARREKPPVGLVDEGPRSRLRVGAWVGVASTLAFLTAGAIFGLAAQSRADELSRRLNFVDPNSGQPRQYDQTTNNDFVSLKSDGQLYNGLAIGFYSLAAASAVVTATLFIVDSRRAKAARALRLQPALGPGYAGLHAGWSF